MKIAIIPLVLILAVSMISADILISEQPKEIYNIGDIIKIPIIVKSLIDTAGILDVYIICGSREINFYRNGIGLTAGEEIRVEPLIVLNKNMIGETIGECRIKASLGEEYILTTDFIISNLIILTQTSDKKEFKPGASLYVKGSAVKENGKNSNGFLDIQLIISEAENLQYTETIKDGIFLFNSSLPSTLAAGQYLLKLNAYEKDSKGETTNTGFLDANILITQVPTSLEIFFENTETNPGENLRAKAILHDQSGQSIASSTASVTIKNKDDKILNQMQATTDEFFEFPIPYNEPPGQWTISAESNKLKNQGKLTILEKEAIDTLLINKTLAVTNIGNVPYNKTIQVKVENETLEIKVDLAVDESKKYILTAPNGEYQVEIMTEESRITGMATLSGKKFGVKEAKAGLASLISKPFLWIFLIMVLGLATFLFFRRVWKKPFFGFISKKKLPASKTPENLINSGNKAELSLSIKGDKQNASIVCLKIKNIDEINKDAIQQAVNIAEENKAATYESNDNLFFILAPVRTKTFRNEKTALNIAYAVKELLKEYNKNQKTKIDFGVSVNYGAIIAKQEKTLKFASLGTLMTTSRKIASASREDVLLSEEMAQRVSEYARTERHKKDNTPVYTIKQFRDSEENKRFLKSFLKRVEKD